MDDRDDWHLTDDIKHEAGSGDPFAAAVRATRMPMVITDPAKPDNPIIFCNAAFQSLTGYSRPEIIGRNCRFLQGPDTDPAAVRRIHEAIAAGEDVAIELLNYRKDGSTFWNALYLSPVRGESGAIQFFFASQLDITDRILEQSKIAEQKAAVEREVERRTIALQQALEAKTLLLHEVDHRVKNNLTMIGSLLRLQARTIGDPAVTGKLEAMLERVDALATVHRRLYQSDDVLHFDVGAFAQNLVLDVVGASGRSDIAIGTDIEPIEIRSANAAALGLILNEILTNAIKHGFANGRPGKISIAARSEGSTARVTICDDGPGLDGAPPAGGLGAMLIKRLSKQIGASVEWDCLAPGTCVTLRFPVQS
ncbi:PAS domain-containing protein [Allosphingosinicella indica]|uniref:PAS domain S-box-containing protein n=1 Tax=Allosphingosinicella indica TaxID=941907 RepID=A0A1X7FYI0_9SPHN|nr:PAS domain-containing protein [Allosphingosinicella indica]SMF61103.1 PAS domain S-box-containing protein [Allosphingosinicella indica]